MLLDDLDLALVVPLDDGGVVGIDQVGVGVKVLDELIVRQGVGGVAVDTAIHEECVDGHACAPLEMSNTGF